MLFNKYTQRQIEENIIPRSNKSGLVLFSGNIRHTNASLFWALSQVKGIGVVEWNKKDVHEKSVKDMMDAGFTFQTKNAKSVLDAYNIYYDLDFECSFRSMNISEIENNLINLTKILLSNDQLILTIQSSPEKGMDRLIYCLDLMKLIPDINKSVVNDFKEAIIMRGCTEFAISVELNSSKYVLTEMFY